MSNLDDFFKKRDKKKKTTTSSKSKFSTLDTEKLAKNLEAIAVSLPVDPSTEVDTDFQNDTESAAPISRVPTGDNLDEEWKPFDSEENKDYTGLRINTNTWKDEEEDGDFDNVTDENSIKPSCPWGASGKPKVGVDRDADDNEEDQTEKKSVAEPPKTIAAVLAENTNAANVATASQEPTTSAPASGAYIPPSMRARMAAEGGAAKPVESKPAAGAYVPPSMRGRTDGTASGGGGYDIPTTSVNYRRPNKSQPNLNDCLEFPSLDASGDVPTAADMVSERFEFAKKSGKIEPKNEKDSQIHIQNKFGALSGNQ